MKQNLIFSAGRIMMMVLAVVLTFGLTGCSKDDDGEVKPGIDKNLIGTWKYVGTDNGTEIWAKFTFNSDGTGSTLSSKGYSSTFTYQVISPNYALSVVVREYIDGSVYKYEDTWRYHVEGNVLTLEGETLRRN